MKAYIFEMPIAREDADAQLQHLHAFLSQFPFFMVAGSLWKITGDEYRAHSLCNLTGEGCGLGYLTRQRRVIVPEAADIWRGKLKKGAFDNWNHIPLEVDEWTAQYMKDRLQTV
jgi:hypothetical protein